MATLSHSESRRLYSWWWDSHNTPKNSKWLQENLTDMDTKVKSMIKLIEEDADSFARRAEMYYKKRPELMKLVEEFYRAYRALAERYNHATGELRHAHRTIAKAFPDQVPLELLEDSPSKPLTNDKAPHTPEIKCPARAFFDSDDLHEDDRENPEGEMEKFGLRKLHNDYENLKEKVIREIERAGKAENEAQCLKKALADMQAEKDLVLLQYQQCLQKLSSIEEELMNAQTDSMRLNEKASGAEIEVRTLKEALVQLETEKNAGLIRHKECLDKISDLELMLSRAEEDTNGLRTRAVEAESEAQALRDEISRLELEKEAVLLQYKQCLGKISVLENVISVMEDEARLLKQQAEKAEAEVSELKKSLADLNKEKEASAIEYKSCLQTISKLEKDIAKTKEDVKRLNSDVLLGNLKLKNSDEKCGQLEISNLSLQAEATNLAKKIAMKDQELSQKQEELKNLQTCLKDERFRHAQIEGTLETLQNVHSQSQEDQRALALELKNALQMLKDLEVSKHNLEEELKQVLEENGSLSQKSSSSAASLDNMQNELFSLREMKERLEKEVLYHIGVSDSLQQEIFCLKEEIEGLNRSYQALVERVEAAGLTPTCIGTSVKSLQDENSKLRQICEQGKNEKEILSKKLENAEELLREKVSAESSHLELNNELESSREKVKSLQESCQNLHGEKGALVSEKAFLVSQLQSITENMHKLLEKNAVLENDLSSAKIELEGLREKSKGLEEICELLKDERSYLLTERGTLVSKLENVERKLECMEKRYMGLEEKYSNLEKEKKAAHDQVEELKVSLSVEKQERTKAHLQSETMLAGLENQIHLLKEENRWKKKEYEEELDKALKAQFEISILQKFIKDMEEKNYSLIIECQKHVEASKLAEKLIKELESDSLEQQVEAELLLDEIERLRLDIYQVFRALETDADCACGDKIENEGSLVHHILRNIEDMKCSIFKHEDDKQLLLVENSVLQIVLEQLESKGIEIKKQNMYLEKEFKIMAEKLVLAKEEKAKLLELNEQLKSDVEESDNRAAALEAEFESLCVKQEDLRKAYNALQETYLQANQDNKNLLKRFSDLKEEKFWVDQQNDAFLQEILESDSKSMVLRRFGEEKLAELNSLLEDLKRQHDANDCLGKEISVLTEKMELQEAENLLLRDTIHKSEREMREIREDNVQMKKDIVRGEQSLLQTEGELLETEMRLEAAENMNSELFKAVNELKTEVQESLQIRENLEMDVLQLSENSFIQTKEIENLHMVNTNLEAELGQLREEIEEKAFSEQILSSELKNKNNEFELWEAEAAAFYFDLQISSVNEVFFKSKVKELTRVCRSLENENASKTSEIEQMKEKICLMESEVCGLTSRLQAYAPIIAALRDDITLLEHNALLQTKLKAARNQEQELSDVAADPRSSTSEKLEEDPALLSLQGLQVRIKAVAKMMEETKKPVLQRRLSSKNKQESIKGEIEQLKSRRCLGRENKHEHSRRKGLANEQQSDTPKLQKIKTKATEVWNGMRMKDIPLDQVSNGSLRKRGNNVRADDQMLELWETAENSNRDFTIGESLRMSCKMTEKDIVYDQFENVKHNSEPPSTDSDMEKELGVDKLELSKRISQANKEVNKRRVLERLTSDAQKLENLQTTVEILKAKLETSRKTKKAKKVDYETVHEQLVEAEETVAYLVDLNDQLRSKIQECPSPDGKVSPRRKKVVEQARKGSERIGRLQLELQKIHFIVLKMEDDKKNKGKNKFFRSKTIVLRDFIYNGRKKSEKRKKGPLCACFRPSASRNGRS